MADTKSGGIGLGGVLLVVFIVLKLIGAITWSWWWVLSPLWIPVAGFLLFIGFMALLGLIFSR